MDLSDPTHRALVERTGELVDLEFRRRVRPATAHTIEAVMSAIAPVLVELRKEIAALRKGQDGVMKYVGVWKQATPYSKGEAVTHGGSLWVCEVSGDGGAVPGHSPMWKLAVKRGEG